MMSVELVQSTQDVSIVGLTLRTPEPQEARTEAAIVFLEALDIALAAAKRRVKRVSREEKIAYNPLHHNHDWNNPPDLEGYYERVCSAKQNLSSLETFKEFDLVETGQTTRGANMDSARTVYEHMLYGLGQLCHRMPVEQSMQYITYNY